MRRKIDTQLQLGFQASNLSLTNAYFAKYEAISRILLEHPELVGLVHEDLKHALKVANRRGPNRFRFTSDNVLRILLCQVIEGESLRGVTVRIDDSHYLRKFARIYDGPMMDFTTLCKLKNAIRPKTWEKVNRSLAEIAVREQLVEGQCLRVDTTAVETNIHWPSDSALLWDCYRTLARSIHQARRVDPQVTGNRRIHLRRVKRLFTKIARKARAKGQTATGLKSLYTALIGQIEGVCAWALEVVEGLERGLLSKKYPAWERSIAEVLVEELRYFEALAGRIVWQARERVVDERPVSNNKKLFSIFEPHTELLKRGKAGKEIEFGHMLQIQQVQSKFITGYRVFSEKPVENTLVEEAVESHRRLFGRYPRELAADKAYWSRDTISNLEGKVALISIGKMGRCDDADRERERDPIFRHAQRFRAGIEGTLSFLKRVLGLERCLSKGWQRFVATIGATIFGHNLLILARC